MIDRKVQLGLACGDVADAMFPHVMDRDRRQKVAVALVGLSNVVIETAVEAAVCQAQRRGGR